MYVLKLKKKKQNKFLSKRHKLTEKLSLTALIKTILNASIRRGIWVPMLVLPILH